jgi:hypothetical protein
MHLILRFLFAKALIFWGDPAMTTDAIVPFLIESTKKHYFYYHLISGTTLPIVSNKEMHSFFSNNAGKEFVTVRPANFRIYQRYARKQILSNKMHTSLLKKKIITAIRWAFYISQMAVGYDRVKKYFPQKKVFYGCNWWSITDNFACFLSSRSDLIIQLYKNTFIPEESFIQTFLCLSPYSSNVYLDKDGNQKNILFDIWPEHHHGSPKTLTIDDFSAIKESKCIFARKFSSSVDMSVITKVLSSR